jgi:glycine cleavage system H lipoate-binding protein
MYTHDPYMVKAVEYLVGVGSLALFVLFWRYVNGEPVPAAEKARVWSGQIAEWFRVPERLLFHPGHGWARMETPGVVRVGLDDFAQHLVGRVDAVDLPQPGARLQGGAKGWTLRAGGKAVDMLAPVSGTVVAVNDDMADKAGLVNEDPYGRGWLMKVQVPGGDGPLKGLLSGAAARGWIDKVSHELTGSMSPELGHLCQDGGLPVHGIARAIDEARWDEVARRFLQT